MEEKDEESDNDAGVEIGTPEKPSICIHNSFDVEISWVTPNSRGTRRLEYELLCKQIGKKYNRRISHNGSTNTLLLKDLNREARYSFRVRAVDSFQKIESDYSEETFLDWKENLNENQESELIYSRTSDEISSDISEDGKEELPTPSFPTCQFIDGSHSMVIQWDLANEAVGTIDFYEVLFKDVKSKSWRSESTSTNVQEIKVNGLKENTTYTFRVRSAKKGNIDDNFTSKFGNFSPESIPYTTDRSIASKLIAGQTELIKDNFTGLAIYKLECHTVYQDATNGLRHVIVGSGHDMSDNCTKRYMLMYGQTGAGKSTFIDLIVNHVYDVDWEDNFRLTAVDLMDNEKDKDESMPQTQWITCYEIKRRQGSLLPFDLVVIDTPGFNDSALCSPHQELQKKFEEFITSDIIPGINALCFVSMASSGKLTHNENNLRNIFTRLFDSEISESVLVLATFADSSTPKIVQLWNRFFSRSHECFKFNNTPFTLELQMSRAEIDRQNWISGKKEVFKFFRRLESLPLMHLTKTRENIAQRSELLLSNKKVHEDIESTCKEMIKILNQNVQYRRKKVPSIDRVYTTFCNKCRRNCCSPCFGSWISYRLCNCITFISGECKICNPGECSLRDHEYGAFKYKETVRYVKKPSPDGRIQKEILESKKSEILSFGRQLSELITKSKDVQNRINGFSKTENMIEDRNVIDILITKTISEKKPEWRIMKAIFLKCNRECEKPRHEQWTHLVDFTI